ncbi:MAG: TonB-dependent receptor, partial [Phycisphaerales bacterium]|nr:TonB-dependent receptor [Phycisphaerales bacterium]
MNDGWVHVADRTRARNLFLSLVHGPFSLQVIDGARRKQFGDGLYSTIFGDNRNLTRDQFQFVDVRWRQIDDESGGLTARVYQGMYRYGGTYAYDVPPVTLNVDEIRARWWGAEAQYARTLGPHHLTIGAEYVNVPGALLRNFDVNEDGSPVGCVSTATATPCLDARSGTGNAALFVQDDVRLAAHWRLAGVLRHDRPRGLGSVTSPRLSVIYSPRDSTAIKLIYGSSFRTPNLYERAFTIPGYKSSPNIRPERVRTIELVAEHSFRPNLRALGSIFEYRARDLVTAFIDPVDSQWTYGNVQSQRSRGVELELQGRARWLDVRASVSAVNTKDETTGTRPPGSSARIAKFRAGVPWHDDRWHLGMEARH